MVVIAERPDIVATLCVSSDIFVILVMLVADWQLA